MKKLKKQLNTIAKSLASLSKQVEKVSMQVDKLQPPKKAPAKKKKVAAKKRVPAKKAVAKKKAPAKKATVLDSVLNVIKRTRKGVNIATLREKTGLDPRQLSNALYKLTKKGVIVAKSRGVYVKK